MTMIKPKLQNVPVKFQTLYFIQWHTQLAIYSRQRDCLCLKEYSLRNKLNLETISLYEVFLLR